MSVQWPVKILLVHPKAPFLQREKLTVAADCAVLSNNGFWDKFRRGETVIIGCPLLEDPDRIMNKLSLVAEETSAGEIDVYTMEVPCCHALHMMTMRAIEGAGKNVTTRHYIIRIATGEAEPYRFGVIDESMLEAERKAHGHAR